LQEGYDKRAIYLQAAVVADEAHLPEPIHKFTYPCAGGESLKVSPATLAEMVGTGFDSLVICPNNNRTRASRQ